MSEATGIKHCGLDIEQSESSRSSTSSTDIISSSTSSSYKDDQFFLKFRKAYVWDAINHYLTCNKQSFKSGGQFTNYAGTEEGSKIKNQIEDFEKQLKVIEEIHNYFIQDQKRHIETLMELTPAFAFNDPAQKTQMDVFSQVDCAKLHDTQHNDFVKQLLQTWGLWNQKFDQEGSNTPIHICFHAKDILTKKSTILKDLGSSIETIQSLFWRRISREDFLNREHAIRTIQRHLRSNNLRSSIEHMFFKPKNMIHVGGAILDLSMEEVLAGKSIHKLDLNNEKPLWNTITTHLPRLTAHAGVAVSGNKVIICGGRNCSGSYLFNWETKTIVYNSAHLLTLHDVKLITLPSMGDSRSHHGFVTFKGSFWAIGGSNGLKSLSSVESFDITQNKWFKRPSLQQERSGSAVTVHNNQIWVIGGRNTNGEILSSVEVYDPKERKWRYYCSIPKPLLLSAAVSNFGHLYLVGGLTGNKDNPIAEAAIYRWDNLLRLWKFWNKMKEPRLNHSVTRYGKYISICGGHGLVKGVPTHVSGSVSFCVSSNNEEIYTPMIGTQRIGVGIAMVGDSKVIDDIIQKTRNYTERRRQQKSDCISCFNSSFIAQRTNIEQIQHKRSSSEISFQTHLASQISSSPVPNQ